MSPKKGKGKRKALDDGEPAKGQRPLYNIALYVRAEGAGHIALFNLKTRGFAPGDFPRAEKEAFYEAFDQVIKVADEERANMAEISVSRSDDHFYSWRSRAFERALKDSEMHYQQHVRDVAIKESQKEYSRSIAAAEAPGDDADSL